MRVLEIGRKAKVERVAFAPGGQSLVAIGPSGTYLWRDIANEPRAETLAGAEEFQDCRFTSDGRWLLTSRCEWHQLDGGHRFFVGVRELCRIDLRTGASATSRLWDGSHTLFDVSPAAPFVLVKQDVHTSEPPTSSIQMALWRVEDLSPTGKVWERELGRGASYYIHPPQFLASGDRFALLEYEVGEPFRVVIYDTTTGTPIAAYSLPIRVPREWALSSAEYLFVAYRTSHIDLHRLDMPDAGFIRIQNDTRRHFTGIALHPGGRFLAAASNDQTVKLYDITNGTTLRTFTWQLGRLQSVCFSPDGALGGAGTENGQVIVWDVDL